MNKCTQQKCVVCYSNGAFKLVFVYNKMANCNCLGLSRTISVCVFHSLYICFYQTFKLSLPPPHHLHLHSSDSQSFNKVAERVLLRLQEKLKGVEEGAVLSVGGQVNLLIQQAMDPANLSRLFSGWQAWV